MEEIVGRFSTSSALAITKEAITAALQDGTIKLLGTGSKQLAEENAKADALYLATLANSMFEQLNRDASAEQ
ncbi:hypothetical protein [Caballeronia grimmiae]|uniref:Uncharacterized protein n=1 Tax=Caballeronia grimmiae TaxID=1071679 RepID=A0A069P2C8_9BURK|nr:hypothetical protein [Caballeronia grimmiae]KDR34820.1 hypothetical protein BG57_03885 [Caballeronia grimmiae]GGD63297.1 hypothetical protein GCM10010985_16740 [Caballeronia grimmiae]